MSLLYFNSHQFYRTIESDGSGLLYLDCIESTYARIETFFSVAQLFSRLRNFHYDILGAVLIISSISEMIDLIQNLELLEDIPIFLILPIDDPEMNSLGHALRPRYMTAINRNDIEIRELLVHFVQKRKEQFRDVINHKAYQADEQE